MFADYQKAIWDYVFKTGDLDILNLFLVYIDDANYEFRKLFMLAINLGNTVFIDALLDFGFTLPRGSSKRIEYLRYLGIIGKIAINAVDYDENGSADWNLVKWLCVHPKIHVARADIMNCVNDEIIQWYVDAFPEKNFDDGFDFF